MSLVGSITAGHAGESDPSMREPLQGSREPKLGAGMGRKIQGTVFGKKTGSGGKLGKTSQLSAGLSRLRGKGALA